MKAPAHVVRNGFSGKLLHNGRADDQPEIVRIAADAQEFIHDFLGNQRSEGHHSDALRFHAVNDLNLFRFRWKDEAQLLLLRLIVRQA